MSPSTYSSFISSLVWDNNSLSTSNFTLRHRLSAYTIYIFTNSKPKPRLCSGSSSAPNKTKPKSLIFPLLTSLNNPLPNLNEKYCSNYFHSAINPFNHYVTLRDKFIYLLHENNKSQHFHNLPNFHPSCKFDITKAIS